MAGGGDGARRFASQRVLVEPDPSAGKRPGTPAFCTSGSTSAGAGFLPGPISGHLIQFSCLASLMAAEGR